MGLPALAYAAAEDGSVVQTDDGRWVVNPQGVLRMEITPNVGPLHEVRVFRGGVAEAEGYIPRRCDAAAMGALKGMELALGLGALRIGRTVPTARLRMDGSRALMQVYVLPPRGKAARHGRLLAAIMRWGGGWQAMLNDHLHGTPAATPLEALRPMVGTLIARRMLI